MYDGTLTNLVIDIRLIIIITEYVGFAVFHGALFFVTAEGTSWNGGLGLVVATKVIYP